MKVPPVIATNVCVHCGALSQNKEGKCWLCYEDKSEPNPFAVSGNLLASEPPQSLMTNWDVVFSVLLGICVFLTLLIGIGLAVEDKGLLVPFAIFMGPAYAVTIFRGTVSFASKPTSRPASLFVTFVVSILVTFLVSILLIVAAMVLLFLICIGATNFGR